MAKQPTEQQLRAGQRMKQAADEKGLNAYEVAKHLGVRPPTVYRWYRGSRPDQEILEAFARLVGRAVSDFWVEEGRSEWRLRFLDLVAGGVPPGQAIEQVAGQKISPEEHEALRGYTGAMRRALEDLPVGRWASLSPAQRQAVLHLIEVMAAGNDPPNGTAAP